MSSFISSFMPLSIIVRVISRVYEKCIYYAVEKPESKEEAMLCNVILSRYENMRSRIVNGGCDTDVGLKSIEDSLLDVIVYEQQYQDLCDAKSSLCDSYSFCDDENIVDDPSQGLLSRSDPSQGLLSHSDIDDSCCLKMITLEKCRDETEMLNVSVNLNLSHTEFKNNIISTEDDDNEIHVTYEDHPNDDDDIYS
jgi:hypothetical protein